MNRSWSIKSGNKISKINYTVININESTKERACINADKENEKKYRNFCEKASSTSKKWENTGVKMNLEVPRPPKPNNYERLVQFKRKNVLRPAIEQSKATLYLSKHGYELEKDYDAYQAIDLAKSLKSYSRDLKKKQNINRKSKLEDLLNVKTMSVTRRESSVSFDFDDLASREDDISPTNSTSSSGEESLTNSIEFQKQGDLLNTINEFRILEEKNQTNPSDLQPIINMAPSAPPPEASAPPASRNLKKISSSNLTI